MVGQDLKRPTASSSRLLLRRAGKYSIFLDPETIENLSIYFDPKKTSRIVIKKILNYYHHGEKCGKLLVGMSEKSKRVSEK